MTRSRDVASNGGLVLITSQSFTNSTGISINNCFSSTYDNYKIIWTITSGPYNTSSRMRLRANGTDLTSSSYYQAGFFVGDNAGYGSAFTGNNSFIDLNYTDPNSSVFSGDIFNPYVADYTGLSGVITYGVSGSVVTRSNITSARVINTTQYDGATFYPVSGTMTGKVQIYGYKN